MKAVALIDCNNFYVSCERLFEPKLNGRPVIVLSNNDGCVVSRSQEVKDMGIPMGVPLFQIREQVERNKIAVYSSNYTLYGDISSRVHEAISHFSDQVENYSIDEAFAEIEANQFSKSFMASGIEIRESVKCWTGIPSSVGIGPTKTLAKIAGSIAKKSPTGVFNLTDKCLLEQVLDQTDIIDIWGINKRTAAKLQRIGIVSAKQLRDMELRDARKLLTVVGARLVEELRGNPCLNLELIQPRKKNICSSRSFAGEVKTFREMADSVIHYLSTAAEKMRRQKLNASAISVFIETARFKEKGVYANSGTLKIQPTDSTLEMIPQALRILKAIYKPGYGYRKSGVLLLGLQPIEGETKRLFDEAIYLEDKTLMSAIDAINLKYGRGTVRFGSAQNRREQNWHTNRNFLSKSFTTNPDQFLTIYV
ncbi:MAG: Y-family DNA polymerase [Chloracidobacterium sp.]|nr:Y-family DNA polymerase [Chloracidobacterium sp.]